MYPQDIDTSSKTYCVGEISDAIEIIIPDRNGLVVYYQWYSNINDNVFSSGGITSIVGETSNSKQC